jgi:beta-lactamase class C
MFVRVVGLFLIMLILISANFNVKDKVNIVEEFDKYTSQVLSVWKIPGLAYAIVRNGKIEVIRTRGVREAGKPDKINKETIFRIASLSKAFTATLAAKLHCENKIDLDQSLVSYLPDIKFANNQFTQDIKVTHVLSHTTGLPPRALELEINSSDLDQETILDLMSNVPVEICPGTNYGYQNVSYNYIAKILSDRLNTSFDDLIKSELFVPLKLKNTSVGSNSYLVSSNKALPHLFINDGYFYSEDDLDSSYYKVAAAGGINSSIQDMAYWLIAQMGYNHDVIPQNSLELVQKRYVRVPDYADNGIWNKNSILDSFYGLGWRIHNYAGEEVIHHSGGLNGFATSIAFIPKQDLGIVVLTNSSSPVAYFLTAKFLDLSLGLPYRDYSSIIYQKFFKTN